MECLTVPLSAVLGVPVVDSLAVQVSRSKKVQVAEPHVRDLA